MADKYEEKKPETCTALAGRLDALVMWALNLGLSTGHADTEQDLLDEVGAQIEEMQVKLHKILQWAEAYPLDIFPEPDFKKAAQVLKDNGMTLDAISASNMRHVITSVKKIILPIQYLAKNGA